MNVSGHYRRLAAAEVEVCARQCDTAWQDPAIPQLQWNIVKSELEYYRTGGTVAPYNALVECLMKLPVDVLGSWPRLLDIGSGAGHYYEVLRRSGFNLRYTGVDYSPAFQKFADKLYGGMIDIDVSDARNLDYRAGYFDIVISGATIMHIREYEDVIAEAVRVCSKYLCFHRTPIMEHRQTAFFVKEAYGVPCLEIHFNETELLNIFAQHNLSVIYQQNIFWNGSDDFGHRNYLLKKC